MIRESQAFGGVKKRIVMVDDEPDFISIVESWLTPNYEFIGVLHGRELMDVVAIYNPDLVILDVNIPGPNGFTICRKLRASDQFCKVPILFLTGCTEDKDVIMGWESGSPFYLAKPVTRPQLLFVVDKLLSPLPAG